VLGPRDLLKTKQLIKLGVPLEPNADWTAKKQKIENLPFSSLVREEFFRRFAEAMNSGEVEAVLVEAVLESPNGGASGAGGPGASGVGGPGGIGAPPVPGAIVAPGPGDGGAAAPASQWHGVPVPLAKATPLTRESFQKFVDDQFGPASGR
jgi:hypothetical protein